MKRFICILGFIAIAMGLVITNSARATLHDRGNGCIYDDDLDITWMQYTNTAVDTEYDNDGLMTKNEAYAFVDWFNNTYNPPVGYNWRLPITPTAPDLTCSSSFNEGFGCTQSEMGHLYYTELGNSSGEGGLTNRGPFQDIQIDMNYWTDWDFVSPGAPDESLTFKFRTGLQARSDNTDRHYVWLVHDGDIAPQTECNDGVDNDGDGSIDLDDPGCQHAGDDDERHLELRYLIHRFEYIPTNYALRMLVMDGMPWCPPSHPGCPGNRLSIHIREKDLPSHIPLLGKAIWRIAKAAAYSKSFETALRELQKVLQGIPPGTHFDKEMQSRLFNAINSEIKQRKTTSGEFLTSAIFIKSWNAIELDWRLPKLKKQKVNKGKHVSIDLGGMVWVGLKGVVKPGEIALNIKSKYEAFPAGSEFSPSWPFLSYVIDFDGKLEPEGFLDLTFYVKPLRFKAKVSTIKVLRFDKEGMIDVTTGRDLSRGTVMARTDRPGTFIIVGKD